MTYLGIHAEVYQSIGSRRLQEDGYVVAPVDDGHLAAVFDGHWPGSDRLVPELVQQLPIAFARECSRLQPYGDVNAERRVLRGAVRYLVRRHQHEQWLGSTASVAWVLPARRESVRVHVAMLGDSPAALWDGRRVNTPPLHAPDHHPDTRRLNTFLANCRKGEGEDCFRYRRAGVDAGYVWRVRSGDDADGVAMTRSIGDGRFGTLLVRRPELHTRELPIAKGAVILATDGVLTGDSSPSGVRAQMRGFVEKWVEGGWSLERVGRSINTPSGDNRTLVGMRFWC